MEVSILDPMIVSYFIQFLEMKNTDVKFVRLDSDITENLIDAEGKTDLIKGFDRKSRYERIVQQFKDVLGEQAKDIRVEGLKDESVPVVILQVEQVGDPKIWPACWVIPPACRATNAAGQYQQSGRQENQS